ncbi:MAG: hypothetical protein IJT54_06680 [Candidatus Methanomethylophilaceae archaeon]|nr:hypothetical protein [Candidatus Methanomethylophilaceae archaeon]
MDSFINGAEEMSRYPFREFSEEFMVSIEGAYADATYKHSVTPLQTYG